MAFILNAAFTALEFLGGWLSGSIAILSDAVHDLGDTAALGLALFVDRLATRHVPDDRYTYGLGRWSLAGALINALVLVFGSALVLGEAADRLREPAEPRGLWMLGFAILGMAANGYGAWRASRGHTLNERIVSWHLIEDVIGWAAVFVGALVLLVTDWHWIDPVLAIAISLFILFNVLRRLRDVTATFLQAAPTEIDVAGLRAALTRIGKLSSVHHLHAWSLDGENHVISCHAVLDADATIEDYLETKKQIRTVLSAARPGHVTIELEFAQERCPERDAD